MSVVVGDNDANALGCASQGTAAAKPSAAGSGSVAFNRDGTVLPSAFVVEKILAELREHHVQTCRERTELRRERAELADGLKTLEHELQAEEIIGEDLQRRIETLEEAIHRDRVHYEGLSPPCGSAEAPASHDSCDGNINTSHEPPAGDGSAGNIVEDAALAAYLDRLPIVREHSCRDVLHAYLHDARVRPIGDTSRKGTDVFGHAGEHVACGYPAGDEREQSLSESVMTRMRHLGGLGDCNGNNVGSVGHICHSENHLPGDDQAPEDDYADGASDAVRGLLSRSRSAAGRKLGKDVCQLDDSKWSQRWSLCSHLDSVRCVIGDDSTGVLFSCGDDALVKVWDLAAIWRGVPNDEEPEPYATLRTHAGAVLSLAYRPQDRLLFSAGMDRKINVWNIPDSRNYNAYSSNLTSQRYGLIAGTLEGHNDCVWSLGQHPHLPYLASASADGLVGMWLFDDTSGKGRLEATFKVKCTGNVDSIDPNIGSSLDIPATLAWIPTDLTKLTTGYTSSRIAVFDVKHGTQLLDLAAPPSVSHRQVQTPEMCDHAAASVTSLCAHQVVPLVAAGHADGCARLVDLVSGRYVATLSDHTDAVTSVCMEPLEGNTLVTACHDGYVRSFDLRVGRCFERLRLHRSKFDEAINGVYHGSRCLASAGADASISLLLQRQS